MTGNKKHRLFESLDAPHLQLASPDTILSPAEFELLKLTVEDFRFIIQEPTADLSSLGADIRARSTILRRLLVASDLFKAGKLFPPKSDLRVTARMLDFEPPHPSVIISSGNYPWKGDLLPGMSATLSIRGVEPLMQPTWSYREDADVTLVEYLDGLAIAVLGTRIRRRELIKYVADKKAAHVSDKRKYDFERAMDRAWSTLAITIVSADKKEVTLNTGYLEILAVIEAMAQSPTLNEYINELDKWLQTATPHFRLGERPFGQNVPKILIKPLNA
jgi:hypothetical protein